MTFPGIILLYQVIQPQVDIVDDEGRQLGFTWIVLVVVMMFQVEFEQFL